MTGIFLLVLVFAGLLGWGVVGLLQASRSAGDLDVKRCQDRGGHVFTGYISDGKTFTGCIEPQGRHADANTE